MKHTLKLAAAVLGVSLSTSAFCQDVIVTKNKEHIIGKVNRVTPTMITYVGNNSFHGELTSIEAENVRYIVYESGDTERIHHNSQEVLNADDEYDMSDKGRQDAKTYYKGYKGARAGTTVTTVLTGDIFGLIPAIACSSTPPSDENLNYPSKKLMKNEDYGNAYRNEARHIKRRKVWGSYALGAVINVGVFLLIFLL